MWCGPCDMWPTRRTDRPEGTDHGGILPRFSRESVSRAFPDLFRICIRKFPAVLRVAASHRFFPSMSCLSSLALLFSTIERVFSVLFFFLHPNLTCLAWHERFSKNDVCQRVWCASLAPELLRLLNTLSNEVRSEQLEWRHLFCTKSSKNNNNILRTFPSGKEFPFKSGSKLLRTFFWCLYRKGVAIHAYLTRGLKVCFSGCDS